MDARLPVIVALSLVLAGCGNLPAKPKAPTDSQGLQVFEQLIGQAAAPDSIVRIGDEVSYVVMPTKEKSLLASFTGSCDTARPSGSMYYWDKDSGRMRAFFDKSDSNDLPSAQLQVLLGSEQLRQACAYRPIPDWRVLDTQEGQDQLLLDRNSAVREGGLLKIWTGTRLAEYQPDKWRRMIGEWQQRLAVDCAGQTYNLLSQFSVNDRNEVHNGSLTKGTAMLPVAQATSAQRLLIAAACKPAEAWGQLAMVGAHRPGPPHLDTPTVEPAVLDALRALNLPEPRLTLASLTYEVLVMHGEQVSNLQQSEVLTRDPRSGLLVVQPTTGLVFDRELRLTFRGLIDLGKTSISRYTGKQRISSQGITGLTFIGDWQRLPENTTVTYTLTHTLDGEPYSSTTGCSIGVARPASQINPSLQGRAKSVTCKSAQSRPATAYKRFDYLEDYGLFVNVQEDSALGLDTRRVKSVR